jgi:hypothetical protein
MGGTPEEEGEPPPDTGERDIPPPTTPPWNAAPPVPEPPGRWRTWGAQQTIRGSERVSLTAFLGGILAAPSDGANQFDDNAYDVMFTPKVVAAFEAGFAIMPFLNILAGAQVQGFAFGHPRATVGPDHYRFKTSDWTVQFFYLGARFKLPLSLLGKRLFAVSKAEAGLGFVPYAKMVLGVSKMEGAVMNYDPINFPSGDPHQMYASTSNFGFGLGFGAEMRSRVFGAFLELNINMLGSPQISSTYTSMGVSANSLFTITLNLGMSFYI